MIKDLTGTGDTSVNADFLIVGGGTVGLFLSVWLAEAGHTVICLESGGHHQDAEEHPLNEVVQLRSDYKGAAHGRFRCIGGTSTRWGGALIPFQAPDLSRAGWPVDMGDILPFISKIEREFGLSGGSYDLPELSSTTHSARLAKWPPFKKRNVYNLLHGRVAGLPNLTVWLHATVTDFRMENGLLRSVVARSAAGDSLTAVAGRTILAAGAIESTRLALVLDAQNGSVISQSSPAIGRYFSDHLSVIVGEMISANTADLNRHVGFRFETDGTMRNLRFELSGDVETRAKTPAGFAHIGFETDGEGGFDVLRSVFRSLQKRRLPSVRDVVGLIRTAPWLCRAVWMRLFQKRLLFPRGARLPVHMVIDQMSVAENRITLSATRADSFAVPLAEIAWKVSDGDQQNLTCAVDAFEAMWKTLSLSAENRFVRLTRGKAEADLALGGGIYHPTGSTRMGRSAEDGVVDRDLRIFAVPNVQIVSTSSLPTGGGANPTMMLLMLAARCVDQIGAKAPDTAQILKHEATHVL